VCGGCKWQMLPYKEQLFYKQREVVNNLTRIGKVELPDVMPIMGSPAETFYRNKLEYTFSNKRWLTQDELESDEEISDNDGLGFHVPGMFDKVVDIKKCHLQAEPSNAIRLAVKEYSLANGLPFFDLRAQSGLLRRLMIRTTTTGEVMVVIVFFYDDELARQALMNHLMELFPQVTSWMYVINPKANDTFGDLDVVLYAGRDHIFEVMEDLKFKIGPKSFFQTNSEQALHLYQVTREFAGLTGKEVVYDLYTGTGTIANFVAHQAAKVVGIEYVPEAIEDAVVNSELNGITNTVFIAGDMKDLLTAELIEKHGRPDVIITDPPRAGMHTDVVETILNAAPDKIVYVSCNSATQARDLNLLDMRYRITRVQPVDMFPHTHHVENVVLLERR
jgi:23S rRNA (uracil1939-C5)-methyltransferase